MEPIIDVLLTPSEIGAALQADVLAGLSAPAGERSVPPKWFYDERGSKLFDEITRLPEYYPTRRERSILATRAASIMASHGVATLIELGSGTSDKTRLLLDAGVAGGSLTEFVPFDVSEETLIGAAESLADRYPAVAVHAVVGDFDRHLHMLSALGEPGSRLVAFLGGTIGNFEPVSRSRFLSALGAALAPGDQLLLGTDLVKDPARLVAAYDDSAGVTAEFNRNVLAVIDRELQANFDIGGFDHVAVWNATEEWIEMRLRSAPPAIGQGRGHRIGGGVRRRRGASHRDQRQVPPPQGRVRTDRGRFHPGRVVDRPSWRLRFVTLPPQLRWSPKP